MKKLFLSLTVLIAGAGAARAQQADNHFGIKAGGSLTNFAGTSVINTDYLFGFHAGFVANIDLTERFSIQPELLYSTKGAKATVGTITSTESLHYIEMPILLKAKLGQFFVEAGPQLGVLARAKAKYESGSTSQDENNTSDFSTLDIGYAAGLGYQLASGPMIGVRYNGGFTDVARVQTGSGTSSQGYGRNSAFQLYVGYLFGHK